MYSVSEINSMLDLIFKNAIEIQCNEISTPQDIINLVELESTIIKELECKNTVTLQGILYPIKFINSKGVIISAYVQTQRSCKLIILKQKVSISRNKKVNSIDSSYIIDRMYNFYK